MKTGLPLQVAQILSASAGCGGSHCGAFVAPSPLHRQVVPPTTTAAFASRQSTSLKAGLRDLVGDFEDGEFYNEYVVPPPPSVRESPGFFNVNPFVDRDQYERRDFVNSNRRQPRDIRNYYDPDNIVIDTRNRFDRVARIFDNVPKDDVSSAVRNRRQQQGGRFNEPPDFTSNYGGSFNPIPTNPPSRSNQRINSQRQRINDIPIPAGRSSSQLARMYSNLQDGNSNFNSLNVVERYFEAWNRRNVPLALSCFDDNIYYDDTQFSEPFQGKEKLAEHLIYVSDCLPDSFRFVVDGLSVGAPTRRRNSRREMERARGSRNFVESFSPSRNGKDDLRRSLSVYERQSSEPVVNVAALWHVENDNGPLPYARGCSFYMVNPNTNLIVEGYDFPEPAVIKPGSSGLKLLSIASKLIDEPIRFVPFVVWTWYIYVVFFSNGILPGKDAFAFEAKAWEEVRALSLNFFYVAPVLKMNISPSVHPMLEAIFNTLLAWAFMFLGFLSDDRSGAGSYGRSERKERDRDGRLTSRYYENLIESQEEILPDGRIVVPPVSITKRNLLSMLPMVIGMQFLTSAFLLPYLFSRTSERSAVSSTLERRPRSIITRPLYKEELDDPARIIGEWRGLGVIMGIVGTFGVYWFFNGRVAEFGPPLWTSPKRMESFMKLLSGDRVGASFIVDLVIFSCFQGWLVEDDWKRRGRSVDDERFLRNVAKYLPFWGMACYLTFRPGLPSRDELDINEIDARNMFRNDARNFNGSSRDSFTRGGRDFNNSRDYNSRIRR